MPNYHDGYNDARRRRDCQPVCRLVLRSMTKSPRAAVGDLVPGFPDDLCLGFANTCYYRGGDAPTETLADLDALLAWCRSAALLSAGGEKALRRAWRDGGRGSQAVSWALGARCADYPLL